MIFYPRGLKAVRAISLSLFSSSLNPRYSTNEGTVLEGTMVEDVSKDLELGSDREVEVLRSGQMDLSQFGINPRKYNVTVASFLEAFEEQAGADGSENNKEQRANLNVTKEGK
ncbi:unnamed protein product [Sphagnum compactum]